MLEARRTSAGPVDMAPLLGGLGVALFRLGDQPIGVGAPCLPDPRSNPTGYYLGLGDGACLTYHPTVRAPQLTVPPSTWG
jgi:hypothetical protein